MSFDLKIKNGDLSMVNGKIQQVEDSEKLIQDILKICLTNVGSNPFHPWYGSYLSRSIIGSAMDISLLTQISNSQLTKALDNLKNLQEIQVSSFQRVTADEQINAIIDISVLRNVSDYRYFDVKIKVFTKGGKPITTAFNVSTI